MVERGVLDDASGAATAGGLDARAEELAAAGRTPMYVALDGRPAGLVAVADTVKPTARPAVAALQARGIEVVMITGDNPRTAESVGPAPGPERVFAGGLPPGKAGPLPPVPAQGQGG